MNAFVGLTAGVMYWVAGGLTLQSSQGQEYQGNSAFTKTSRVPMVVSEASAAAGTVAKRSRLVGAVAGEERLLAAETAKSTEKPPGQQSESESAAKSPEAAPAKVEAKTSPAAKTHTVAAEYFKMDVSLKGIFESRTITEIAVRPETWNTFTILKIVPQGTRVKRGDSLVDLDLKPIDEAIRDQQTAVQLTELALEQAGNELKLAEQSLPMDLVVAERAKKQADEDFKRFQTVDKSLTVESLAFDLKYVRSFVDNEQEELAQLEKMYKADDLTEATEEIVLRRQRDYLEQARFLLKSTELNNERALAIDLPRREEAVNENVRNQTLAWEKAKVALRLAVDQKKLLINKMQSDLQRGRQRLDDLQKDRQAMIVTAPVDGIVYYGQCIQGSWSSAIALAPKLIRGGLLRPHEVFLSIVDPTRLDVRATIPEAELAKLQVGLAVRVVPTGFSETRVHGLLETVPVTPTATNTYEATVALTDPPANIMPGMTCTVKLTSYSKENALTVPETAVFAEDRDEDAKYVLLDIPGKKPEKKAIKIGKTCNKKTEVLEGLSAGDNILLEKPEAKTSTETKSSPGKPETAKPTVTESK